MDKRKTGEKIQLPHEFGRVFTGEKLEELAVNTIRALSIDAVVT